MFFENWLGLARVIVGGLCAYGALLVLLRLSGKRTLAKMNAFDLIVTVALGSTLATVLVSKSVPIAEGVLALALLIALQFAITWLSVRSDRVERIAKSEPSLVVRRGEFLVDAMRAQRLTRAEILAAARERGYPSLEDVAAVVLETDGTVSVIGNGNEAQADTVADTLSTGSPG